MKKTWNATSNERHKATKPSLFAETRSNQYLVSTYVDPDAYTPTMSEQASINAWSNSSEKIKEVFDRDNATFDDLDLDQLRTLTELLVDETLKYLGVLDASQYFAPARKMTVD